LPITDTGTLATGATDIGTPYRRDLSEYLEAPLRRPLLVVVPFVLITVLAVCVSFALTKKYKTSTLILVESEQVPQSFAGRQDSTNQKPRLLTIQQEILSRTRLEQVIRELDPYAELSGMPVTRIVETMRSAIAINVKGNDAFTVEYVHRDPQKAVLVANRLATLFIEESAQARADQVAGVAEFIESQLQDARNQLEVKEKDLRRYKEAQMGRLPEQTPANLATLQRLQLDQQYVADNLRAAREKEIAAEKSMADQLQGTAQGRSVPLDPSAELNQLRSQLVSLRGRYTDEHPDMRMLVARIARLEKMLAESAGAGAPPVVDPSTAATRSQLEQARTEVKTLKAKRDDLEKRIALFQARVEEVPRIEQELTTLTRDHEKLNENYLQLLHKKLDVQMAERLEKRWKGERFRILDPAYLPEQHAFPNRLLFLLGGMALGLVVGLAASLAAEVLDPTLKNLREIEAVMPYPVLATFPRLQLPSKTVDPAATSD
jgi:polysaccharide chain length determinant protein (PEP-CTERM system associated)